MLPGQTSRFIRSEGKALTEKEKGLLEAPKSKGAEVEGKKKSSEKEDCKG